MEDRFLPSTKAYDWLGEGIYFWEYAPYRALDWAVQQCSKTGGHPVVLRATVRLGRCLNLLDIRHISEIRETYLALVGTIGLRNLPQNTERGAHFLDRAVIDAYCRNVVGRTATPFQTVRGTFPEGSPLYQNSKILTKAHTQVVVRDASCILRVCLVEFA